MAIASSPVKLVEAAGDDVVADRVQRAQIVQRHAAHQPAARATVVGGEQHLAIEHGGRRRRRRGWSRMRATQRLVVVDLLAGIGLDGDVAVDAENARHELALEAAHDAGDDDQRGDAERDADQGEDRDDGDEALALAGAQVAAGDGAFEGTEHSARPAERGNETTKRNRERTPPPLEGGGQGEGASAPGRGRNALLPPALSLKGRSCSFTFAFVSSAPATLRLPTRASASSGVTSDRSPVARRFSSTFPAAAPRGPTMICHGCPIRSASANLAPARSSRSSYSASRAKLRIQRLAQRVAGRIAASQVQDRRLERRDAVRPDDAGIVVAGLDHRADQARHADAVAAHLRDAPSSRPAP